MRSHGKHIEKGPGLGEILSILEEHEDLKQTAQIQRDIQQILDL